MTLRRWSEQPSISTKAPGLPPRPGLTHQSTSLKASSTDVSRFGETEISPRSTAGLVRDPNLSITLIRRDPTSGGQWNVGKISAVFNARRGEVSRDPRDVSSQARDSGFLIEIMTPGYVQFIEPDKVLPVSMSNASSIPKLSESTACFQRHLLTKTSRPVSENLSSNSNSLRHKLDSHRYSTEPIISSEAQGQPCLTSSAPSTNNIKAYTFLSPWNGSCEFTTGIAGRSLKCKHILPSAATSPAVTVSELRFNLPSSKIFGPASPKRPPLSAVSRSSRESSFLNDNGVNRPSESVDFDNQDNAQDEESVNQVVKFANGYEDHVDGLGREHAGGGLGGKQAKLGKLIIEDEGLKMLDLLVAANMGIWWGVYGRAE